MISLFLSAALAQIKKLDPEAFTPLSPFIDKVIQLNIGLPFSGQHSFYVLIQDNALTLTAPVASTSSDFVLEGKLFDFGRFTVEAIQKQAFSSKNEWIKLLHHHQIQCYGDLAILQAFQASLQNISIDWSALWAKVVGDKLAFPLTRLFKKNIARIDATLKNSMHSLKEYMLYETNCFASSIEVDNWIEQAIVLRNDTERLEKQIILLKNRFEKLK